MRILFVAGLSQPENRPEETCYEAFKSERFPSLRNVIGE